MIMKATNTLFSEVLSHFFVLQSGLTICKSWQNLSRDETHLSREREMQTARRPIRGTDVPKMLIAYVNANEAGSFLESSFGMRIANWASATRWRDAPMADTRDTNTATQQPVPVKKALVVQSAWDGNLNEERGNTTRELWRPAESDKSIWKPLWRSRKI